jgi:hypothetical protein
LVAPVTSAVAVDGKTAYLLFYQRRCMHQREKINSNKK